MFLFSPVRSTISFLYLPTFVCYSMIKPSLKKGSGGTTTHSKRRYKEVLNFPLGISPKVIIIARVEFELAYYEVVFQHVNH